MKEFLVSVNDEMERLQEIVRRLRGDNGCPWDREQTHKSLKPYLLEETYEVMEAIDKAEPLLLCEELGDVLLHIVMHSAMAQEEKSFALEDVVRGISEKMIRRHPHVFGEIKVKSVNEVWENWDRIKKGEKLKENKGSILDSVPQALPALMRAEKLQRRAARIGFDWDSIAGAWNKVHEEIDEVEQIISTTNEKEALTEELGDLLFSVVNVTRKLDIDAEEALRRAIEKFMGRFSYIEQQVTKTGKELKDVPLPELDRLWNEAKQQLKDLEQ
ncbi:MAG TPA: nucleoside triphosphate pyrophosphohydrolase [Candidatus Margulisbacteria bacterium]|nr:nucleoside triphosphate pyrophosphohydrolase [Candidatus Margulisiibacteriota bacterium]HCT86027.1 nucleoside triphosphate pyrophosphohydrolase [Candidatus Margulisiibacteriota bacterium]